MAKILPPNRSDNVDKLHLLKTAFCQLEKQQWHSIYKRLHSQGQQFCYLKKIVSEHIHGWCHNNSFATEFCIDNKNCFIANS